jgi:hypothetical protein
MIPIDIDASSPGALVDTVYRFVSGRADEPRDWAAFHWLSVPDVRLMFVTTVDGSVTLEMFDAESYERSRTPMLAATDFYERDVARRVERFGDMAHVWSEFEARHAPDAQPFGRGVTSFQLVRRDDRWWIVTALWQTTPC